MLLSRLPLICAFILLAVLAGSIYWQTFSLFNAEPNTKLTNTNSNAPAIKQQTLKKTHNIAAFKLFGDALQPKVKPVVVQENLPKTTLKLTLTGVLVNPTGESAGALILGPDKQTQHYKIEDELPGGATLKEVFSDRVVVNRSGRLENLYFIEQKTIGMERFTPDDEPETEQTIGTRPSNFINNTSSQASARSQNIRNRLSKLKKRIIQNKQ